MFIVYKSELNDNKFIIRTDFVSIGTPLLGLARVYCSQGRIFPWVARNMVDLGRGPPNLNCFDKLESAILYSVKVSGNNYG